MSIEHRDVSAMVIAVLVLSASSGCAGDANRARAEDAVRLAAVALDDAGTSGGEDAAIEAALGRSRRWLDQSEQAVELWGASGSLAYETSAPCLGSALGQLRDAFVRAGRPVPANLEEAEALALDAGERPCAERVAP